MGEYKWFFSDLNEGMWASANSSVSLIFKTLALVCQQQKMRKKTSLKTHLPSILQSSPVYLRLLSAWLIQVIPASSSLNPVRWRRAGLSLLPRVSLRVD